MTEAEAKRAFMDGGAVEEVTFRGPRCYKCISAIIFRHDEESGKIRMSVELSDRSGHSVTVAKPENVERSGGRK